MPASWRLPLASSLAALLWSVAAQGMELRGLRTEPAEPGVAQRFRVVFEPRSAWHESENCSLVLRVDGETFGGDLSRQPNLDLSPGEVRQWQGQDWRVPNRSWPREGKEAAFQWTFLKPGRHEIRFQREGSSCRLTQDAVLTVDVPPRYDALSWVLYAPRGRAVSQGLDGRLMIATPDGQARVLLEADHEAEWRAAFAAQNPRSWEQVMEQVALRLKQGHGARGVAARSARDDVAGYLGAGPDLIGLRRERAAALRAELEVGQYVPVVQVDAGEIAAAYAGAQAAALEQAASSAQRSQAVLAALAGSPQHITALKRAGDSGNPSGKASVCARRPSGDEGPWVTAYSQGAEFLAWAGAGKGFDQVTPDLDALYTAFVRGSCRVLVMTGADAALLAAAAQREQLAFELLDLRDEASLLPQYQAAQGYKTLEDAQLSRLLKPRPTPRDLERLRSLGLTQAAQAEAARQRMAGSGYAGEGDWSVVAQFAEDEAAGRPRGLSAAAARKDRLAREAAQAAADREKSLRAYPYSVTLTCRQGPLQTVPVYTCLIGGGNGGSASTLELQNCGHWRTLGYDDLAGDQAHIALCPRFVLRGRNSSEFVLTATLKDERSGKELERQSATRFRGIALTR